MPTHQVLQGLLEGISSPTSYWTPSMEHAIATGDFTSTIKKEDKQPHTTLKIFWNLILFSISCTSTQEYTHDSQYNKALHFWFSVLQSAAHHSMRIYSLRTRGNPQQTMCVTYRIPGHLQENTNLLLDYLNHRFGRRCSNRNACKQSKFSFIPNCTSPVTLVLSSGPKD